MRVLVIMLTVVSQCPALAAGMIMAASAGGDHAVSCSIGSHAVEVVLAHHHEVATPHRHTMAEQLIITTGGDDRDHPDHRFRLARETSVRTSDHQSLPELQENTIAPAPAGQRSGHWCTAPRGDSRTSRPPPPAGGSPTRLLLEGIVMRR